MATAAEVTMICLDNSSCCLHGHPFSTAQIEAVKLYCEVKFKCNSENRVGLLGMSSSKYAPKLSPTNDLSSIVSFLNDIFHHKYVEEAVFFNALAAACSYLYDFEHMNGRLLVFVGSPIDLHWSLTKRLGNGLKLSYVALDVVNFLIMGEDRYNVEYGSDEYSMLYGTYHYGREQLVELVTLANTNDNSHFVDMVDVDENSVRRKLQKSRILRKYVRYCKKKDKKKAKKDGSVEVKKSSEGDGFEAGENEKLKLEAA